MRKSKPELVSSREIPDVKDCQNFELISLTSVSGDGPRHGLVPGVQKIKRKIENYRVKYTLSFVQNQSLIASIEETKLTSKETLKDPGPCERLDVNKIKDLIKQ